MTAGSRSWWAAKIRRFRAHVRARVSVDERQGIEGWTTGPQRALFDSMHVADRRHGLDVFGRDVVPPAEHGVGPGGQDESQSTPG